MVGDRLEYQYVILDTYGKCWLVRDNATEECGGLPSLLRQGWRPVRERAFEVGDYMLILLERGPLAAEGFGFGTK